MMDLIFDADKDVSSIRIEGRRRSGENGVFVYDVFIAGGRLLVLQRFRRDDGMYEGLARVWDLRIEDVIRREFEFDIDDHP